MNYGGRSGPARSRSTASFGTAKKYGKRFWHPSHVERMSGPVRHIDPTSINEAILAKRGATK